MNSTHKHSRAYALWLDAVYNELENALGCTRSDAQGIADAQPFALAQSWGADKDALEAAEAVLKAAKPSAAGQAACSNALPWSYDDDGFIYNTAGFIVSDPHSSPEIDMDERERNAAFIVRACNSHAALVEFARNVAASGESGPFACADFYSLKAAARAALQSAQS